MPNYSQDALYGTLSTKDVSVSTYYYLMAHYTLIMFGPLVRFWVMQFKGKHNFFKDIAHRLKCYHNVEKSMAERHQLYSSYMSMSALDKKTLTGVGK